MVLDQETHELLARVAAMYYEQDMTQNQIADELGLSRVKVYRLLREARATRVVQINIDWPIKRDQHLEAELQQAFGLRDARVLKTTNEQAVLRQIGHLAARYLESMLAQSARMAVCLGRTTYEVIHAIRPDLQANVQVVQAIGTMPHAFAEYDSTALARQLAQKLGGQVMYLPSPLMADSAHAAAVIRSQRDIQLTLAAARSSDIALFGVGNLDPASSGFVRARFLSSQDVARFVGEGAVGDIAWHIFTEDGELYLTEFSERVIGITLDDLKHIPTALAVAVGTAKSRAIVGALRTGVIDVLCIDDQTARKVLEIGEKLASRG